MTRKQNGTVCVLAAVAALSTSSLLAVVYTPVNNAADPWSTSTNWSSTPVSSSASPGQLTFIAANGTTLLTNIAVLTNSSSNDISANTDAANGDAFYLNILDLGGKASATSGANATINVSGNALEFTSNGATTPVINLYGATNTQTLTYNVSNNIILASNTTLQQTGTATFNFSGGISGAGKLSKSGASGVTLSGVSSFQGGLALSGGTLALSNSGNTFTGGIAVSGGTLNPTVAGALASNALTFSGGAFKPGANFTNDITVTGGTTIDVNYANATFTLNTLTIGKSGANTRLSFGMTGSNPGNVTFSGQTKLAGNAEFYLDAAAYANTKGRLTLGALTVDSAVTSGTTTTAYFSDAGSISSQTRYVTLGGSMTDNGDRKLAIALVNLSRPNIDVTVSGTNNSYTGPTTVSTGSLTVASLADGGTNSSIGASDSSAANLVLNGGTFKYNGGTTSTNRLFTLGGNASVDASGSGAVTFSNAGSIVHANSGVRTLTLTGTSAAANTFHPILSDNGASATSLTKSAAGKWVLTGANAYTGLTTVSAGTLMLDNGGSLATSKISIAGGTLSGGSTGAGGTLHYLVNAATSDSIAISSGSLDISNLTLALSVTNPTATEYVIANKPVGGTGGLAGITGTHFASVSGLDGYAIDYDGTTLNPNSIVLVIPEPSTITLFLGVAAAGILGRRRHLA